MAIIRTQATHCTVPAYKSHPSRWASTRDPSVARKTWPAAWWESTVFFESDRHVFVKGNMTSQLGWLLMIPEIGTKLYYPLRHFGNLYIWFGLYLLIYVLTYRSSSLFTTCLHFTQSRSYLNPSLIAIRPSPRYSCPPSPSHFPFASAFDSVFLAFGSIVYLIPVSVSWFTLSSPTILYFIQIFN